jgi:hypothetical protein
VKVETVDDAVIVVAVPVVVDDNVVELSASSPLPLTTC